MKVLMVTSFTYQKDGQAKTGYNVGLQKADGTKITATAYEPIKDGDEIAEDRLHPGKREGEWVIWSEKKGGKGNYPRNDELTIAQTAFRGAVDLLIANKLNVADLTSETCTKFAQIIKRTAANIKDTPAMPGAAAPSSPGHAPAAGQPPSPHGANPDKVPPPPNIPIKNMGQLRSRITEAYPTLRTVAAMDSILGKEPITDFDAAFQKVVEYMEKPI